MKTKKHLTANDLSWLVWGTKEQIYYLYARKVINEFTNRILLNELLDEYASLHLFRCAEFDSVENIFYIARQVMYYTKTAPKEVLKIKVTSGRNTQDASNVIEQEYNKLFEIWQGIKLNVLTQ